MTKSEKIFNDTRFSCKKYIDDFGYADKMGFARLSTELLANTRTCNDIQKIIDSKIKWLQLDYELEVMTKSEYNQNMQILEMVQNTLNNHISRN